MFYMGVPVEKTVHFVHDYTLTVVLNLMTEREDLQLNFGSEPRGSGVLQIHEVVVGECSSRRQCQCLCVYLYSCVNYRE